MRYRRNPVCVSANAIKQVGVVSAEGQYSLVLDDGRVVHAPKWMFTRSSHTFPFVGDYWVVNEDDGSISIYPKVLFERQYRPIEELKTSSA